MAFNQFPYSNFHELNLDWILNQIRKLHTDWDEFKAINAITFRGVWSIDKQYPAWSIVTDGNKGYVSLKPVPAGIDITNGDYWLRVIDYDALFTDMQNRIKAMEQQVEQLDSKIDRTNASISNLRYLHALPSDSELRKYIDAVNGNDNNDGTQKHPWKTLTPLFNMVNRVQDGRADIRCYFTAPGVYDMPYLSYTGMAIHMTGLVDGVVVNQIGGDFAIYGGHFNLKNVELRSEHHISLEASVCLFNKVTFNSYPVVWGGKGEFNDCTFNQGIAVNGGHAVIKGHTIIVASRIPDDATINDNIGALYSNNGNVELYNDVMFKHDSDAGTENEYCLLQMYRTHLVMGGVNYGIHPNENTKSLLVHFEYCQIYSKTTLKNDTNALTLKNGKSPNWWFVENGVFNYPEPS